MNLNRLIKKIEEYTKRNLDFSMKEFEQLQELREDVLKLQQHMDYSDESKDVLLEHYKKHAKKIERNSERIERKLNIWIQKLEKLINTGKNNLTKRDNEFFNLWKEKLDICRLNLAKILSKGGELHKLINKKSPNWKQIGAKISEAFGDKENPGILILIDLFNQLERKKISITKELSKEELSELIKRPWPGSTESTTGDPTHYSSILRLELENNYEFYKKFFKNRTLIEIGAGTGALILPSSLINDSAIYHSRGKEIPNEKPILLKLGIKKYIAIDEFGLVINGTVRAMKDYFPSYKYLNFYNRCSDFGGDGLSFLKKQRSNSAIICSAGVFELYEGDKKENDIFERYLKLLAVEIYRVTPKKNITLHLRGIKLTNYLLQAGFRIIRNEDNLYVFYKD